MTFFEAETRARAILDCQYDHALTYEEAVLIIAKALIQAAHPDDSFHTLIQNKALPLCEDRIL